VRAGATRGAAAQAVPLYLSEMAPPQMRGGLNIMFQMATTIGARPGQGRAYLNPGAPRGALCIGPRGRAPALRRVDAVGRPRLAARTWFWWAGPCACGACRPAGAAERGAEGRARAQASSRRSW